MKRKQIRIRVTNIMTFHPETRDNDNLLLARTLKDLYGTSDLEQIATVTSESICDTITRMRRLIQSTNPFLASSKNVTKARARKEAEFRDEMGKGI